MVKYYTTKHKNKTVVGEMDAFRAILFYIYSFFLVALKASIFYVQINFPGYFSMSPALEPGFSSPPNQHGFSNL